MVYYLHGYCKLRQVIALRATLDSMWGAAPPQPPIAKRRNVSLRSQVHNQQFKGGFYMNRTRPKQIVIRMSEEEYQAIKKKVDLSGKSQQDYLINVLTNKVILNTDGIKAITPDLKRIGVNLNQIAKICNQGKDATYDEIHRIGEELNDVWRLLKRLAQGRVSDEQ